MNFWKRLVIIMGLFIVSCIILIGIPSIVGLVTTAPLLQVDTESQWISFWGNYLGALIGGIISGSITLFVLWKTIGEGRDEQRRNEKTSFCEKITDLVSEYCTALTNASNSSLRFSANFDMEHYKDAFSFFNEAEKLAFVINVSLEARFNNKRFYDIQDVYKEIEIVGKNSDNVFELLKKCKESVTASKEMEVAHNKLLDSISIFSNKFAEFITKNLPK